jgi:hypothetical protein
MKPHFFGVVFCVFPQLFPRTFVVRYPPSLMGVRSRKTYREGWSVGDTSTRAAECNDCQRLTGGGEE